MHPCAFIHSSSRPPNPPPMPPSAIPPSPRPPPTPPVTRQDRLVRDSLTVDDAARQVRVREDGLTARQRSGLLGVDRYGARVGMPAARRGAPEDALQLQVWRIREIAERFEGGIWALDR